MDVEKIIGIARVYLKKDNSGENSLRPRIIKKGTGNDKKNQNQRRCFLLRRRE
jgi:hypothetical protein